MQSRHITLAAKLSPRLAARLLPPATNGRGGLQTFRPADEEIGGASTTVGPAEDGAPVTRWQPRMSSLDGRLASGVWDSTAGTHTFEFGFDEWIHVLQGEAHVTVDGETHVLRAGDTAFFRAGLLMTWVVPEYIRKVWVHRYPKPNLVVRATRRLRAGARGRIQRLGVEVAVISVALDTSVSCF